MLYNFRGSPNFDMFLNEVGQKVSYITAPEIIANGKFH